MPGCGAKPRKCGGVNGLGGKTDGPRTTGMLCGPAVDDGDSAVMTTFLSGSEQTV